MPSSSRQDDWRLLAAKERPHWTGDISDDCTALWAGFMLRAEWMDESDWWWCVYEQDSDNQVASSNDSSEPPVKSGEAARTAAENAARGLLGLAPRA